MKTRGQEAEQKQRDPSHKAHRWVVERTHSWLNRLRKLLVSFEKTEASYLGLLSLIAAHVYWRQAIIIYGLATVRRRHRRRDIGTQYD